MNKNRYFLLKPISQEKKSKLVFKNKIYWVIFITSFVIFVMIVVNLATTDGDVLINELFQLEDDNLSEPIFKNGKFDNPWSTWSRPKLTKYIKYLLLDKNNANIPTQQELDETLPVHEITDDEINEFCKSDPDSRIKVVWLGHSTLLVNFENKIILTDPVFSQSFFPLKIKLVSKKRYRDAPIQIDRIPRVDAVILSHNHRDHLDKKSVIELNTKFGNEITWFIPLGTASWFESVGIKSNLHELTWWQSQKLDKLEFVFMPAQHWSGYNLVFDRNRSLWGGWIVLGSKKKIYFAGDTGYCPAFSEIGRKYGPIDLSFIPIGAYKPRWMLRPQHVDPEEAVRIHLDVKSVRSIGIHWGTFQLGHEFYLAPKQDLEKAANKSLLGSDEFKTYEHGQINFF